MKHLYFFMTVSALLLSACEEERLPAESWADGTGGLRLEQPEMQSETDIPVIVTRNGFGLEPGSFPIHIEQEDGNGSYSTYTSFVSYNAMLDSGMPLVLPVGDYRVVATSYEASDAGSGVSKTPYFEGSQEFVIEEKTVTSVPKLLCTFESVGVELQLSEQFRNLLETQPLNYRYTVSVQAGTASWTFNQTNTAPVYFLNGCEELVVKVSVKLDNLPYPERTYRVANEGCVRTGEYYIITLDAGPDAAQLATKCIGGNV